MNTFELIYIEPKSKEIKDIREILRKQGEKACNHQLSVQTISDAVSIFTFGWISYSRKAQLGRRSIKSVNDQHILTSFILCTFDQNVPDQITVEIVCSTIKTGKLLMELVEEKAKGMNIKRLQLFSLAISSLKTWYETLGFKVISTINLVRGVPKVYSMVKII